MKFTALYKPMIKIQCNVINYTKLEVAGGTFQKVNSSSRLTT